MRRYQNTLIRVSKLRRKLKREEYKTACLSCGRQAAQPVKASHSVAPASTSEASALPHSLTYSHHYSTHIRKDWFCAPKMWPGRAKDGLLDVVSG